MLCTIIKVSIKLRNGILEEKLTVHVVGCPEESAMPRSDMRGSTVDEKNTNWHMEKVERDRSQSWGRKKGGCGPS